MNAPRYDGLDITPTQVAQELLALGRELATLTKDLEAVEKAAVESEEAYTLAYSKATLLAGERGLKSADLRKAQALKDTTQQRLDAKVADAAVKARRMQIDTLKTRVTIGQSVATALRSELDLDGLRRR
jgi:hypothetical protein